MPEFLTHNFAKISYTHYNCRLESALPPVPHPLYEFQHPSTFIRIKMEMVVVKLNCCIDRSYLLVLFVYCTVNEMVYKAIEEDRRRRRLNRTAQQENTDQESKESHSNCNFINSVILKFVWFPFANFHNYHTYTNFLGQKGLSKQYKPRSDAMFFWSAEHSIWSGSKLCVTHPAVSWHISR